jgi:MFS family permease
MTSTQVSGEPMVPVRRRWIGALTSAVFGMSVAVLTPIQILLPAQIAAIDPAHKVGDLGWITTVAAIVSILICPVAGALCDRTTSRFGRRRPWVLGSAVVVAVGLLLTGGAHVIVAVALSWLLVQAATNAMYAALTASVPDRVPVVQRGVVSAFVGLAVPLALVVGSFLVSIVVTGRFTGYLLLAVLVLVLALPYVLDSSDTPITERPAPAPRPEPAQRRRADLFWAYGCRLAIQLANAVGTLYLFYYLQDVIHAADPAKSLSLLIALYVGGILLTSVVAGWWSDRVRRRKPFVIVSSVVIAAAMTVFGLGGTWHSAMIAAVLMGIGYGVYIAVDNALITQVLPSPEHRARDLGIINSANTGPQALAPAIAALVITHLGGYTPLYLLAGVCALIGAVLIQPVTSLR